VKQISTTREGFRKTFQKWTQGLDFGTVFVILGSTVLLILFHENGSSRFFQRYLSWYFKPGPYSDLYPALYWFAASFVVLGVVALLSGRWVLGMPWSSWGIGMGDWRFGLKASVGLFLLFLPVLVGISFSSTFQYKYPLYKSASLSASHFLVYEFFYVLYFIGWEFIFRGFMLFGLKPKLGYYCVFIQTVPFAVMHFGKPQVETLAAVFAGVILGYLALRSRSFWYGWLLHSLVAVSNDVLAVLHKGGFQA
jgi:membrane protease YdiL (CAAX protease family)